MEETSYSSVLSAAQWASVEFQIPPQKHECRPRQVDMYGVVNVIFHLARTGSQKRLVVEDFSTMGRTI